MHGEHVVVWIVGFVRYNVFKLSYCSHTIYPVVVLSPPRVLLRNNSRYSVEQLQNLWTAYIVEDAPVYAETDGVAPFLKGVVFHTPSPETREPVRFLKVGTFHDNNSA